MQAVRVITQRLATVQVWRDNQEQLVGWFKRQTCREEDSSARYDWHAVRDYSIVLTKGCIMHSKYLAAYTNEMPQWMLDFVKEHRNCEDIAMQFLVSNRTGTPPVHIRGRGCALAKCHSVLLQVCACVPTAFACGLLSACLGGVLSRRNVQQVATARCKHNHLCIAPVLVSNAPPASASY